MHLLFNGTRGQSTNDPLQVQSLERDQHQAGGVVQVYGTFWIHDMMCCSGAHILLKTNGGSLVHSAGTKKQRLVPLGYFWSSFPFFFLVSVPTLSFPRQLKLRFISPTCYKDAKHLALVILNPIIYKRIIGMDHMFSSHESQVKPLKPHGIETCRTSHDHYFFKNTKTC